MDGSIVRRPVRAELGSAGRDDRGTCPVDDAPVMAAEASFETGVVLIVLGSRS